MGIFHLISKPDSLRRVLLIPAGVILALFLLEFPALIGVLDYRQVIKPMWGNEVTNISDPELLHIKRPYTHSSGQAIGGQILLLCHIPLSDMTLFRWDIKYDHNGFRNAVDLKSADLVVIGDSVVEGYTIPDAEVMTSALARLQGKVVANLSQYGYGPRQELILLRRYGLPLQPHTVVWVFYESNDLRDVIEYDWRIKEENAPKKPPGFRSRFLSPIYERSFTRNAYYRFIEIFSHLFRLPGVKRSGIFETPDGKRHPTYFVYSAQPFTSQELHALDETTHILAAAHKLSADHGFRLLVVFAPMKFRVFHGVCQFPQESECRNWALTDLPERLRKAVGSVSSDIGYLDLTPSLVDALRQGRVPYYPDDDHLAPEGHKIAAEAINDYLLSTGRSER